jgi:hypothetical protein
MLDLEKLMKRYTKLSTRVRHKVHYFARQHRAQLVRLLLTPARTHARTHDSQAQPIARAHRSAKGSNWSLQTKDPDQDDTTIVDPLCVHTIHNNNNTFSLHFIESKMRACARATQRHWRDALTRQRERERETDASCRWLPRSLCGGLDGRFTPSCRSDVS